MLIKRIHILLSAFALIAMAAVSCVPDWTEEMTPGISVSHTHDRVDADREVNEDMRRVLLLYSAGCNSISTYLKEDIEDLCQGWLPSDRRPENVLLVYSHLPKSRGQYNTPSRPVLFRLYSDKEGNPVRDTLAVYDAGTISSSAAQFNKVLTYVKEEFPAKGYGLIFSSHATGYLPSGFYTQPDSYVFDDTYQRSLGIGKRQIPVPVPYIEPEQDPDLPAVKSVGQDVSGSVSYEMDLKEFAQAIPMKLDYLLFDACLMGGIEVAYELEGKCKLLGFSQAEVLAEGFNYKTLTDHLLSNGKDPDPYSVCEDYFIQYNILSGTNRSATISLVDCDKLEPVAEVCTELFDRYYDEIQRLPYKNVQRYYRSSKHWFYDLESILSNAGMTEEESQRLQDALDGCIMYKGATPSFLGEFTIKTFSGFSMYLPSHGSQQLDKYYKTLRWNKITGLVK